jgi:esterase/lipase
MGGCVTWKNVHPVLRLASSFPRVIGLVPMPGTRQLARVALPVVAKVAPRLLSIYLHPETTDIRDARTLVQTVENPSRFLNREIAEWIQRGELVLRGVNVSRALREMKQPLLCMVAKHDGIVPPETARSMFDEMGSQDKRLIEIGDATFRVAHADLFIAREAETRVFSHVAQFLLERS